MGDGLCAAVLSASATRDSHSQVTQGAHHVDEENPRLHRHHGDRAARHGVGRRIGLSARVRRGRGRAGSTASTSAPAASPRFSGGPTDAAASAAGAPSGASARDQVGSRSTAPTSSSAATGRRLSSGSTRTASASTTSTGASAPREKILRPRGCEADEGRPASEETSAAARFQGGAAQTSQGWAAGSGQVRQAIGRTQAAASAETREGHQEITSRLAQSAARPSWHRHSPCGTT